MGDVNHVPVSKRFPMVLMGLRWTYCLLVVLVLLPEGSVKSMPLFLLSIPVFTLSALATAVLRPEKRHRLPYCVGLLLTVVIVLWALFQAFAFWGNPFANPVWRSASEVLGSLAGAISIVPADTEATIVPVLLPFAFFLTGILIFPEDKSATRLLRFLGVMGGVIAVYGLIQYEFFPDYLLFRKKEFYLQDLTSVLVNRNSIATYLGAALLLNAGILYDTMLPSAQKSGLGERTLYRHGHVRVTAHSVLHGLLAFACLTALLLTRSRAGAAATFVALFALSAFFVLDGYRRTERKSRYKAPASRPTTRIAAALGMSTLVFFIFGILGGRVVMRADLQGLEDGRFCAYPSMLELLKDNWAFGTGLGSFGEAYRRYQNPLCGDVFWDRAHSFYLEGWIDLGVIFIPLLAISLSGLTLIFLTGVRRRKAMRWAPATGWAVLLLFVLHSIVDFSIQIPGVAVSFAAIMSGAVVLSLNRNKSARKSEQIARPSPVPGAAVNKM